MRITQKMMTQNAIRHMSENLERLNELQGQVASGKAFQYASDDPARATTALSLRSNLEQLAAYLETTQMTDDWMSASESALEDMQSTAKNALDLALSGVSDTMGVEERQALAEEINVLLQHAVEVANTSYRDNYIFSGFRVKTTPFELVDGDGDGLAELVNYLGDNGSILQQIGPGQTITQNIDGNTAFAPLFDAAIQARDALNANDLPALQTALTALQGASDTINTASTRNGARLRQINLSIERMERTQIDLRSLLSQKKRILISPRPLLPCASRKPSTRLCWKSAHGRSQL